MRKLVWLAVVAISLAVPAAATADVAHTGYPSSIASTGDSITRAFNTCSFPFVDCPQNSWSTGSSSAVNSHYRRILAANAAISGRNYNDAQTGAKMAGLNGQVGAAVAQQVDYVTVLMGANDVCTSSVSRMTPAATLAAQLRTALQTLSAGLPNARIFVASVPNVYRLWAILHTDLLAVLTWDIGGICQSLLANPTSTAPADVARRQQVYDRTVADTDGFADLARAGERPAHRDRRDEGGAGVAAGGARPAARPGQRPAAPGLHAGPQRPVHDRECLDAGLLPPVGVRPGEGGGGHMAGDVRLHRRGGADVQRSDRTGPERRDGRHTVRNGQRRRCGNRVRARHGLIPAIRQNDPRARRCDADLPSGGRERQHRGHAQAHRIKRFSAVSARRGVRRRSRRRERSLLSPASPAPRAYANGSARRGA